MVAPVPLAHLSFIDVEACLSPVLSFFFKDDDLGVLPT